MCMMSAVMDQGLRHIQEFTLPTVIDDGPNRYEFRDLEERVKALEGLMKAAKIYDIAAEQADCEHEEKKQKLKDLSEELGIEINFP